MSKYEKRASKLRQMNAIDNFMFNELTMQEDRTKAEEFCRTVLEPIIEKRIRRLEIEPQKMLQGLDTDRHGIQMDAYIKVDKDEDVDVKVKFEKIIYDLEPCLYEGDSDEKRARFYHALIDSHIFHSGEGYDKLSEVVVIIIMTHDPFGLDRMKYTIKRRCTEEPDMPYEDGDTTIFLYTKGKKEIPSQELKDMLKFLEDSSSENATNKRLESIHSMMEDIKINRETGVRYMHTWDREYHIRKEGREEGLAKGRKEGLAEGRIRERTEIIKDALLRGRTPNEISEWLDIQLSEILVVQEELSEREEQ